MKVPNTFTPKAEFATHSFEEIMLFLGMPWKRTSPELLFEMAVKMKPLDAQIKVWVRNDMQKILGQPRATWDPIILELCE